MGKKTKAHRQKVQARNAQKTANKHAVLNYLKQNGLTPGEAFVKLAKGEIQIGDQEVFGPKSTLLKSHPHTTVLAGSQHGSVRALAEDGIPFPHTGPVDFSGAQEL